MNELQQKPQLHIHDVSGSDFRVREYEGVFEIQRKKVNKVSTGFLWWKKTKTEVNWKFVDKWGNCLWAVYGYISVNNYDEKIKSFDNLHDAFAKIDSMIAGAKYHYR